MSRLILTSVIVVHLLMLNVNFAILFRPYMPNRIGMAEADKSSMPVLIVNIFFYGLLAIITGAAMLLYSYGVFISGPVVILLFLGAFGTCFVVYWVRFHKFNPSKNDKLGFIKTYFLLLVFLWPFGVLLYRLTLQVFH